jgi:hypothetical protein
MMVWVSLPGRVRASKEEEEGFNNDGNGNDGNEQGISSVFPDHRKM